MNNRTSNTLNMDVLTMASPAIYQIEVQGNVDSSWHDKLAGMNITYTDTGHSIITTLIGRLKDQAALAGLLQSLYEMRLPILSVQYRE